MTERDEVMRGVDGDSKQMVNANREQWRAVFTSQEFILLAVVVVMVAFFSLMNPRFLSAASFANILQDWAPIMLLAMGETFVIISAGIDLSVGSLLGLAGIIGAMVIRALHQVNVDPWITILAGVAASAGVGLLVGLVNATLITRARLAPFIATLATMGAGFGLTLVLSGGVQIAGGPSQVISLGNNTYLGIFTLPLIIVILMVLVAWAYLSRSSFGRWTYAVGSNAFAARGAGINVERHLVKLYMLSGLFAGLAGILVYFRLGSGAPTSGTGQELVAIAATVVGGTSLFGGEGSMLGTIIGAFIITSILSGLILIGVAPSWQEVAVGALIAGAAFTQELTRPGRK